METARRLGLLSRDNNLIRLAAVSSSLTINRWVGSTVEGCDLDSKGFSESDQSCDFSHDAVEIATRA
jgi:hypothetical protein